MIPGGEIDSRGYRNAPTRKEPDLVAIGDSHTFGFNVGREDAWPQQFQHITGLRTYNMGVGGYGVLQYIGQLQEAWELKPRMLVIAIYPPNDLAGVAEGLSFSAEWSEWAKREQIMVPQGLRPLSDVVPERGPLAAVSERLAIVSATKRLIVDPIRQRPTGLKVEHPGSPTSFPAVRLRGQASQMDLTRPEIACGAKVATELLESASREARLHGVSLLVLVLPSKQRVYADWLRTSGVSNSELTEAIVREEAVLSWLASVLDREGIPWADAAPDVRDALAQDPAVYPPNDDGHPLRAGYTAYARSLARLYQKLHRR